MERSPPEPTWKIYPSDPRYEVSYSGQVRMIGRKPRRPSINYLSGYHTIVFSTPGGAVGRYVHRMVLETFIGPCPDGMQVSHLDGDPGNNRLDNLSYETCKDNQSRKKQHGTYQSGTDCHRAKLSWDSVREIRESADSESVLAGRYGVTRASIGRVKRFECWKELTARKQESAK